MKNPTRKEFEAFLFERFPNAVIDRWFPPTPYGAGELHFFPDEKEKSYGGDPWAIIWIDGGFEIVTDF